ncbi:MAG: hypothetical protein U1F26_13700 [Lysobacterales bacterium]
MSRILILVLAFAASVYTQTACADSQVRVRSGLSVSEIQQYVDSVDRRLQKGRYDSIDPKQRAWMIERIAGLREALTGADQSAPPAPELALQADDFTTGMIEIEEGGIVCRKESRVGSHQRNLRCTSRKQLVEERERSRESLRDLRRPQSLPDLEPAG